MKKLRRISMDCTGECPRCGIGLAFPYSYKGSSGYLDVCRKCVKESHDDLLAELQEADADAFVVSDVPRSSPA